MNTAIVFILIWWGILGILSFRILLVANVLRVKKIFIESRASKELVDAVGITGFEGTLLDKIIFFVVMLGHIVLGGLLFTYIMIELPDDHVKLVL